MAPCRETNNGSTESSEASLGIPTPQSPSTTPNLKDLSSAVLAAVIDPTMVIGEDGIIVYFNQAACEAFGVDAETVVGSNVSMLMGDEQHSHHHDQYLKAYKKTGHKKMIGRNRIVNCKRRDDGSKWSASLSISEVTLDDKIFFVGTLRDVTQSMEREKLFSSVIDEAIDAIFTINEKGTYRLLVFGVFLCDCSCS